MATNAKSVGDNLDHSHLQQPVEVGVGGAEQIVRCLKSGTEEIQQLIRHECDILFECRICRSIFRALPNLLIHKRNYCCDSVINVGRLGVNAAPLIIPPDSSMQDEKSKEKFQLDIEVKSEMESEYEDGNMCVSSEIDSDYSMKELKVKPFFKKHDALQKSTIIKLNRIDGVSNAVEQVRIKPKLNKENTSSKRKREEEVKELNKRAKKMESLAVSVSPTDKQGPSNMDLRKTPPKTAKAKEFLSQAEQDTSSNLWRKYCNTKQKKCMLCKTPFANFRSLFQHMRNFHSGKRTLFRCLFCNNDYTKPQSLKRHMMKTHKKSQKQVNKMGELIRKNKFVKEMPNGVGAPVFSPTKTGFKKIDPEKSPMKSNGHTSEDKGKKGTSAENINDKSKKDVFKAKSSKSIGPKSVDKKTGNSGSINLKLKSPNKDKSDDKKGSTKEVVARPTKKLSNKLTLTKCMNCGKMFGSMEAFEKHRPACAQKQTSGNDSESGDEHGKTNGKTEKSTSQKRGGKDKKTLSNNDRGKEKSTKGGKTLKDNVGNVDGIDLNDVVKQNGESKDTELHGESFSEGKSSEKDSNEDMSMSGEGDDDHDDDLTVKFEKIKKAGVKVDEKTLSCLMCEMQYSTMSSLIRHCIRHLGWRRFKCKYCRYTAYHKSECKSHLNRVHNMTHKSAYELNKCIIELKSDNEAKTHKINMNISPNQPVRTVKAFTKQTQLINDVALQSERKEKCLDETSTSSLSPTSTLSTDGSHSSLKEAGIRITRSGRISQAPKRKYEMEAEFAAFKFNKKNSVKSKGKSDNVINRNKDQKSIDLNQKKINKPQNRPVPVQAVLNQFGPQLNIPPDQNVQMQCLKIKSSDMEGQSSALKDLIKKQDNVQVVNHQGKKFYVVVMPKGQALPTNVTPTKTDVSPEVINQALTMMKSPVTSLKPMMMKLPSLSADSDDGKTNSSLNNSNNTSLEASTTSIETIGASEINTTSNVDDDFELSRPSDVSIDGLDSGQPGYVTPPDISQIKTKPRVRIERLHITSLNSTDDSSDSPVLEPVSQIFARKQTKDSPPKLGAPYEVCESQDLISLLDDE